MALYADSSVLVSYFVNDANSVQAQGLLHASTDPLIFTALHRLEMRNAFALGVFRQLLSLSQSQAALRDVAKDVRAGRLLPTLQDWAPVFRVASRLAATHTHRVGCRSLDILHVASAQTLGATQFLSFDQRQRTLAGLIGLTVRP